MDVIDTISNRKKLLEGELGAMLSAYPGDDLDMMTALAGKIEHMCFRIGCPSSVKPMIKSIIGGRVKMWATGKNDHTGKGFDAKGSQLHKLNTGRVHRTMGKDEYMQGHFRWNERGYMVTRADRDFLQKFFIDGIKDGNSGTLCGIIVRSMSCYRISDNTTRVQMITPKNNEYAMYYYKDKDQLIANWKSGDIVGRDKGKVLKFINETVK
jgi:hypothetical protein